LVFTAISKAIEFRDTGTGKHGGQTAKYMEVLINHLPDNMNDPLDNKSVEYIKANRIAVMTAARIHDLGKIKVHNCILEKGGIFTPAEREMMKTHVEEGIKFISDLSNELDDNYRVFFDAATEIIGYHHCFYSPPKSDHPDKDRHYFYPNVERTGKNIPLAARLMSLCDVYDALRTERPYKLAKPHETVCEIIKKCSETQFDPCIVAVFLKDEVESEFKSISESPA